MDDSSTGPPSDVTMGNENDEGSKSRDENSSASSSTYTAMQSERTTEYYGQSSIRTGSPLPTNVSSLPSSSSSSSTPLQPGCGCVAATAVLEPDEITISITPTTGGQFDLTIERTDTVENLKKIISKRLKVAKERMCLLYRERLLSEGTLGENELIDGSRLTLLPNVETGLLTQRPEQSVMQALENLNDSQVNDFLSGKAPLNLTMRLGDHMMLLQLHLSTVNPASSTANQASTSTSGLTIGGASSNNSNLPTSHVSTSLQSRRSSVLAARSSSSTSSKLQNGAASSLISSLASALHAVANCSTSLSTVTTTTSPVCSSSRASASSSVSSSPTPSPSYSPISPSHSSFCAGQSPSQSRTSNNHGTTSSDGSSNGCQSWLLYHHHHHHHHGQHHHHHHYHHHHSRNKASGSTEQPQQSTSNGPYGAAIPPRKKLCIAHHHGQQTSNVETSRSSSNADGDSRPQSPASSLGKQSFKAASLNPRALAEATRNLTQKLKQLSSEKYAKRRQGNAIIESMRHHGKGVYSGTFSGTLNPALQDGHGRPKRDISTIIHILNDLLSATPTAPGQYRHSSGRQQSSASPSSSGATTTVSGSSTIGCHDSSNLGYSTEELSKENEATKGKMRRLRLVMEQRRAQRKARKQAGTPPYTTQWDAVTPDSGPNHEANTSNTATAEPQNEPELQPCSPEPVVA